MNRFLVVRHGLRSAALAATIAIAAVDLTPPPRATREPAPILQELAANRFGGEGRNAAHHAGPARSRLNSSGDRQSGSSDRDSRGSSIPTPKVEGPISGGLTGQPQNATDADLEKYRFKEEEYFISGMATANGSFGKVGDGPGAEPGDKAEYKTRILVRRPIDPKSFSGTVFVEWINVTGQRDEDVHWDTSSDVFLRRGYGYVGVSAQKQGVDGSTSSLVASDPVRYSSLHHPGDQFADDIYTQAAKGLFAATPRPIGPLRIDYVVGSGWSQSGQRLNPYTNRYYQKRWRLIDGFLVAVAASTDVTTQVPALWVSGEGEAEPASYKPWEIANVPDKGHYRLWEVAGGSHGASQNDDYGAQSAGGVPCPLGSNPFPTRYAHNASMVAIDRWVRTRKPPQGEPPYARDEDGTPRRDENGNVIGGLRLPPMTVPVATYYGHTCVLLGYHARFSAEKLRAMYPSHDVYVAKMRNATARAVARRIMLPEDAAEFMKIVRATTIPEV